VTQLVMHSAGVGSEHTTLQAAIVGVIAFTVMFSALAIWRLARKG
jgi:hypothetical protein